MGLFNLPSNLLSYKKKKKKEKNVQFRFMSLILYKRWVKSKEKEGTVAFSWNKTK